MDLLQQRLARSKRSLNRSSRSFKEDLARHKRYDSSKTRRAVSQCAIEQAAREAAEQAQRERAAKIAALAKQGGYDSACNMLTSQYGESRTEQLIQQLLRQVKEKMTRLRDKCTSEGTCGNTSVHIQVGSTGKGCPNQSGDESGAPCGGEQPENNNQPQQPAETPNESNPLHKFTARVQAWGKTSGGSWEQSKTTITRKTTQTITGGSTNKNTNININSNGGSNNGGPNNNGPNNNGPNNSGPSNNGPNNNGPNNQGPNNGPHDDADCNQDPDLVPNGESKPGCNKCRNCGSDNARVDVIVPSQCYPQ